MASLFDDRTREALLRRLAALTPAATPRWGRFTPGAMLCHLVDSARMGLGELPVAARRRGPHAFQRFPLKHLMLYVLPFPKGVATAPELLGTPAGDFERDRALVRELTQRLADGPREGPGPAHPFFGPLSRREWAVLAVRHIDHHLRQFGV
jgi:hypothetical protein